MLLGLKTCNSVFVVDHRSPFRCQENTSRREPGQTRMDRVSTYLEWYMFSSIQQGRMLKLYFWLWRSVGEGGEGKGGLLPHVFRIGSKSIHSFILQILIQPLLYAWYYVTPRGYRNELNIHDFCPREIFNTAFQDRDKHYLNVLTRTIPVPFSLSQ